MAVLIDWESNKSIEWPPLLMAPAGRKLIISVRAHLACQFEDYMNIIMNQEAWNTALSIGTITSYSPRHLEAAKSLLPTSNFVEHI